MKRNPNSPVGGVRLDFQHRRARHRFSWYKPANRIAPDHVVIAIYFDAAKLGLLDLCTCVVGTWWCLAVWEPRASLFCRQVFEIETICTNNSGNWQTQTFHLDLSAKTFMSDETDSK
jgi:hypothetical protein